MLFQYSQQRYRNKTTNDVELQGLLGFLQVPTKLNLKQWVYRLPYILNIYKTLAIWS